MRFIGDVHAKFDQYQELIDGIPASIQVGDFGAGFNLIPDVGESHRFIRGNHDSPEICRNHPNWIKDGHFENDMFFFGGGKSIDYASRTEGVDWWRDEELTINEMYKLIDDYSSIKPKIVISHEVPASVAKEFFKRSMSKTEPSSRTSQALDAMFHMHRPDIWICGHWHSRRDKVVKGTRFIVLEELGFIDL